MKKVYLAARYDRRDELRVYATIFRRNGIGVTSRWLEEDGDPWDISIGLGGENPIEKANTDLQDVQEANAIVFFSEDPHVGVPRGSRHVEFGYAMGLGKELIVVGGCENIFHFLPVVKHFSRIEEALDHLVVTNWR
jgi:hypothetical protein